MCKMAFNLQQVCLFFSKPATIHILVFALMLIYGITGGCIFASIEHRQIVTNKIKETAVKCLKNQKKNASFDLMVENCLVPHLPKVEWSYFNSILYAFTIMTTVGFGAFEPTTDAARAFCMSFAIIGIPLGVLVFANMGAFLKEYACKLLIWCWKKHGKLSKKNETVDLSGIQIFAIFMVYILFGAVFMLCINEWHGSFISTLFYTFSPLTGGDFSKLSAGQSLLVPLKLLYASVGLAIATVAIDAGSHTLKKLHHFGRKLKNCASVLIWFGAKTLAVGALVQAVGRKCGVNDEVIDSWNIDELVENAIEEEDGNHNYEPDVYVDDIVVQALEPSPKKISLEILEPTFHDLPLPISEFAYLMSTERTLESCQHFELIFGPSHMNAAVLGNEPKINDDILLIRTKPDIWDDSEVTKQQIGPTKFKDKYKTAVVEVESPKPGQSKVHHDPQKRLKVFEEEWARMGRLASPSPAGRSRANTAESKKKQ